MFTLEFQPKREFKNLERERVIGLVKRHVCDRGSAEVRSTYTFVLFLESITVNLDLYIIYHMQFYKNF